MPIRRLEPGTVLARKGDPADHIYTIVGGWVAIHNELSDGREQIVKFALPGDVVGLDRDGEDYGSTAITLGEARVCVMRRAQHDRLRQESPAYQERLVRALEQSIKAGYGAIASIALDGARERVARLLWSLARKSLGRRPQGSSDRVWAPLGQTHIALATGLTPVHVSRTLRHLREAGLLELRSRWLVIHNPTGIERLAGEGLDAIGSRARGGWADGAGAQVG